MVYFFFVKSSSFCLKVVKQRTYAKFNNLGWASSLGFGTALPGYEELQVKSRNSNRNSRHTSRLSKRENSGKYSTKPALSTFSFSKMYLTTHSIPFLLTKSSSSPFEILTSHLSRKVLLCISLEIFSC